MKSVSLIAAAMIFVGLLFAAENFRGVSALTSPSGSITRPSKMTISITGGANSVAAGKFRKSGSQSDIIYAAWNGALYYLPSKGTARGFDQPVQITMPAKSYARYVFAQDVNKDGLDDAVATSNEGQIYVLLADGVSSPPFGAAAVSDITSLNAGTDPLSGAGYAAGIDDLAFGDFNNDGWIDILAVGIGNTTRASSGGKDDDSTTSGDERGFYVIAGNDGRGGFASKLAAATTGAESSYDGALAFRNLFDCRATVADFNRDGNMDAVIGYHVLQSAFNKSVPKTQMILGNGTLSLDFSKNVAWTHSDSLQDVQAVFQTGQPPWLAIAFNSSTHLFQFPKSTSSPLVPTTDLKIDSTPRGPFGSFNDYNNDGYLDLAFANGNSSMVMAGLNWSQPSELAGSKGTLGSLTFGTDINQAAGGDFDGDGSSDIVACYDKKIYVYYFGAPAVIFYSKNGGADYLGQVPGNLSASYDLKKSGAPFKNDEARSCQLQNLSAGTIITVYDSPDQSADESSAVITVKENIDSVIIPTFEQTATYANGAVMVSYTKVSKSLDGKVSNVKVTVP